MTKKITNDKDWSKYSDASLMLEYNYLHKRKLEIPQSLIDELMYRFNTCRPTKDMCKPKTERHNLSPRHYKQTKEWSEASTQSLMGAYYHRKSKNLPIPDEIHFAMMEKIKNYDAKTRTIIKDKKTINWSKKSDNSIYNAYKYRRQKNIPFPEGLNAELIKRFPDYDEASQTFKKIPKIKTYADYTTNTLRLAYYKCKRDNLPIPDDLNKELTKRFHNYDPEKQILLARNKDFRAETRAKQLQQIAAQYTDTQIVVSVKTVETKEAVTYNDVFINGTKILSNHIDTEIKLLCDDTILAIHGIITNDVHYPHTPTWLAYNAQMKLLAAVKANAYSEHYIQINRISDTSDKINIFLDNNTTMSLSKEKMKKLADGRRFVLENQKTR